jgi:peptidoglycan/xylan/chitin deacetylase (PgdA/CDA1 family)
MLDKTLLLTFDVEEFVVPAEAGVSFHREEAFELGRHGLERALDVLDRGDAVATHFVTVEFSRRFPGLIERALKRGDELALHAVDHGHDYRTMDEDAARTLLDEGRRELRRRFGVDVDGYRANRFRPPAASVLKAVGLRWTSNLHPTWVPGHYDHRGEPRHIHRCDGLVEIPVSVTPRLRLPASWFWMRNLGGAYLRAVARRCIRDTGFLNLYVHTWEFAALPRLAGLSLLQRLSMRRTGDPFLRLLDRFLAWTKERGYVSRTITPFLEDGGWL